MASSPCLAPPVNAWIPMDTIFLFVASEMFITSSNNRDQRAEHEIRSKPELTPQTSNNHSNGATPACGMIPARSGTLQFYHLRRQVNAITPALSPKWQRAVTFAQGPYARGNTIVLQIGRYNISYFAAPTRAGRPAMPIPARCSSRSRCLDHCAPPFAGLGTGAARSGSILTHTACPAS